MGNRSSGSAPRGVRRTFVLLPGYFVSASICIPRAHPHALWLLAWLEQLIQGASFVQLERSPPWPVPPDALLARQLTRELIDLRWAVPDWGTGGLRIDPVLLGRYHAEGKEGLARELFEAQVMPGEWWMDGVGGVLLPRATAMQFDWDYKKTADFQLEPQASPQELLDSGEHDLVDLVRKLGAIELNQSARGRAFFGNPLRIGGRKGILFPLYGEAERILPDELAELEPALLQRAPQLFGQRSAPRPRLVHVPHSPLERFVSELERLPLDTVALGPLPLVADRVEHLSELLRGTADEEWIRWFAEGQRVSPVAGPTDRHFDALAELCRGLARGSAPESRHVPWVLLTSAFLNADNLREGEGLVAALAEAPPSTRILLVYGHASEALPAEQQQEIEAYLQRLRSLNAALAERCILVAAKRRSHEKVILTSHGDWLIGSWNPASSRPGSVVFECSLAGRDRTFALTLLSRLEDNLEGEAAIQAAASLREALGAAGMAESSPRETAQRQLERLKRAAGLLSRALPSEGTPSPRVWASALRAVRAALHPFLVRTRIELADAHQTRDAFVAQAQSARQDLLLASDRLTDSALDGAILRDLRGTQGRRQRLVRLVWGREWAGQRPTDKQTREQLQRARLAVVEAQNILGPQLLTRREPMENHAKLLLVDGCRGLITSENLLSYGGEKGRYESRELGVAFWCPPVVRDLLGRFLWQWPDVLLPEESGRGARQPYAWISGGMQAWYALDSVRAELDFVPDASKYIGALLRDELSKEGGADAGAQAREQGFQRLEHFVGQDPLPWLREEGERLGLLLPSSEDLWQPYTAPTDEELLEQLLVQAEKALAEQPAPKPRETASTSRPTAVGPALVASRGTAAATHQLVEQALSGMVRVKAGAFLMGDDRVPSERPRHRVVLTRDFLLGRTPVTQGLWEAVMGSLPHLRSNERHPEFPIVYVDFHDIQRFLGRLNALPGSGGFDLPTEAQWEYACRAGSTGDYCFGNDPQLLNNYAWSKLNSKAQLHRVGQLKANAWGLHDMHGLVYESVRDDLRSFQRGEAVDPVGRLDTDYIGARGGAWGRYPFRDGNRAEEHFRCSCRQFHSKREKANRVSFRLMRVLPSQEK
ncbi:SUMF1/EgtB/PvdO family nonheme iron enzyme [Myxococcus xanthus]|uniref:SUMF1/EgtB/PvdO family nonheme iron enzyme n=1 Tax=Myxococcus xanthus TaxID=34 RepID=A0A7Y4ILS3_MYXXA|nr:SUMF1/EgtB/PvdO family nonheme iron enzyme [Myxococcus xanthus]NOJ81441.1 SUMF1/EgtB/PvdO family nonheme iron enzyme [Myxococcus xanthus]NOJ88190.1 SUMF1/EgtB/PvdO family nonheme iron enzyme [Myxococcus xanthus]